GVLLALQRLDPGLELDGPGPNGRDPRAGAVLEGVEGVLDLVLGRVGHVLAALLAGAGAGRDVLLGGVQAPGGPADRVVGQTVPDLLAGLADGPQDGARVRPARRRWQGHPRDSSR